jgi:hypothetical protein
MARDPVSLHNIYQREWDRFKRLKTTSQKNSATVKKVNDQQENIQLAASGG